MELQPHDRPVAVPDGHNDAVGRACRDSQTRRQRGLGDNQRMIAAGGQRSRQTGKNTLSVVKHVADAAMHRFRSPHDCRTERGRDRLMPQAHAQDRNRPGKTPYDVQRTARFVGRTGPRRQHDRSRLPVCDIVRSQGVVADNECLVAQPSEIAGQIVDKAVVVVNQQNHRNALIKPVALCQVSSYSACGLDCATTPPPTGSCHQPRPAVIVRIRILKSRAPSKPR